MGVIFEVRPRLELLERGIVRVVFWVLFLAIHQGTASPSAVSPRSPVMACQYNPSGSLYAGPGVGIPTVTLTPSDIDEKISTLVPGVMVTYLGLRFIWTAQHAKT